TVYKDNQRAIKITENLVNYSKIKYITVRYYTIQNYINKKKISLNYLSTD
ncbi:hypothetical protein BO71DRAFT_333758, partial [Aspergillus ellipticus CBS 707.79]